MAEGASPPLGAGPDLAPQPSAKAPVLKKPLQFCLHSARGECQPEARVVWGLDLPGNVSVVDGSVYGLAHKEFFELLRSQCLPGRRVHQGRPAEFVVAHVPPEGKEGEVSSEEEIEEGGGRRSTYFLLRVRLVTLGPPRK